MAGHRGLDNSKVGGSGSLWIEAGFCKRTLQFGLDIRILREPHPLRQLIGNEVAELLALKDHWFNACDQELACDFRLPKDLGECGVHLLNNVGREFCRAEPCEPGGYIESRHTFRHGGPVSHYR